MKPFCMHFEKHLETDERGTPMRAVDTIETLMRDGHPVALWGASKDRVGVIRTLYKRDAVPCAIIDSDASKHGKQFQGIPIMSYESAVAQWPGLYISVSEALWKYQVFGRLTNELGFPEAHILNYEPVERKRGCPFLEYMFLCNGNDEFTFCCSVFGQNLAPAVRFDGDYDSALDRWVALREKVSDAIRLGQMSPCEGCPDIKVDYFAKKPLIQVFNYGAGGICNLRCAYCNSPAKRSHGTWETDADMEKTLEALKSKGLLAENVHFDYAPGEPALHRERSRHFKLFELAESVNVSTNATIYDAQLADCLHRNVANIIVSVDAGTRETYLKLRGKDLFEQTCENVMRYNRVNPGCVDLKYIFFPEVNDNPQDVEGFVRLCAEVQPGAVFLSYDYNHPIQNMTPKTAEALYMMIDLLEARHLLWKNNSDVIARQLADKACRTTTKSDREENE